jgi:hypothetical protein
MKVPYQGWIQGAEGVYAPPRDQERFCVHFIHQFGIIHI